MSAGKAVDTFYALKLSRLLQLDFTDWKAYELGIIDELGNVVNKPKTSEEKNAWSKFYVVARNLKKMAGYVPGGKFALKYGAGYLLLKEIQSTYELSDNFALVAESMVAGDAGGDAGSIASGVNSGSITGPGPKVNKKKKKKKKSNSYEYD